MTASKASLKSIRTIHAQSPLWAVSAIVRYQKLLLAAALVAIVLIAYIPAYPAGFIWDDPDHITGNQTLRTLHGLWQMWTVPTSLPQWYPLVHTTFWLEYHLWGTDPVGYHIVNVLVHAAGVILLWRILSKLAIPGAWLAAAIFAVHPIHVESVAWVTERKNTLSALLYFAAALAYLQWKDSQDTNSKKWYAASLFFFIGALFSKTVVCSLPASLLLIQWWKTGRITRRDCLPLLPMFAIGAVLALTTAWLERTHVLAIGPSWTFASTHAGEFVARTLIAGRALWFYATKLAIPWPLAFIYSRWHIHITSPWQYVFPLTAAAVILSTWLLRHRIGRGPLVAILYFAITLCPALGYFNIYPMRFSFVADHFQHLASIGLTTLAAAGLARFTQRFPRCGISICAALLLTLTSLTFAQCTIYESAQTLWQDTMVKSPDSWMAYTNMGRVLESQGRPLDAIPYHDIALRLAPDLPDTHENVAVGRMLQGRYDEAETEFHAALAINPRFVPTLTDLGKLQYFNRHNPAEAERLYQEALRITPLYAPANYAYGVLLEQQGKLAAAADHYRLAAQDFPDDFDTEYDLGSVLLKLNRPSQAIIPLRLATQLQPRSSRAWINLRAAYTMAGQPEAAVEAAREALQALSPQLPLNN
jgi:Tfp pilus assembly protein PilF